MEGDRKRGRLIIAVLFVALIGTLVASATAKATFNWLGPISSQQALTPQVAMDERGTAVFVWNAFHPTIDCNSTGFCFVIEARARTKAGVLGPVETISDPTRIASAPQVAIDDEGDAAFVWVARNPVGFTIEARTRTAAGVLGPIHVLSDPGAIVAVPQVAVDENGDAVFVWHQLDNTTDCDGSACLRIHARALSTAGVLGPDQTVSDTTLGRTALNPQVAVDENGDAVIVWLHRDGTDECASCTRLHARARSAVGALKPIQTLSSPGLTGTGQVAIDDAGNAVIVWDRFDDSEDCGGAACSRIQVRRRSASGSLSSTQTVSGAGRDAIAPQLGLDASGKAVIVWTRGDGSDDCEESGCYRVQARTRTAGGTLGSTQGISHSGFHGLAPQVGVDERGNAVFVWERIDLTLDCGNEGYCAQVQVRSRTPGGTLTGTKTFPNISANPAPAVAVDPDGGADANRADAAVDWIGRVDLVEAAVQKGGS